MKATLTLALITTAVAIMAVSGCTEPTTPNGQPVTGTPGKMETRDTRIGRLEFERGYPTKETVSKLYDEMDFQRATQAYIWALPIVSMGNTWQTFQSGLGGKFGDLISLATFDDVKYGITGNATTPYLWTWLNLAQSGPVVIEDPAGMAAGFVNDHWQRPVMDIGIPGAFEGKGGKHLVVGPGQEVPSGVAGYNVVHSKSNNVLLLLRNLETDATRAKAVLDGFQIYPYANKGSPSKTKIIPVEGRVWKSNQSRGLEFWQIVSDVINREPIEERDRFFLAMLKPLGIEKGKAFEPNERQKKLLVEASFVGESMAMANDFSKRNGMGHYADGTNWDIALVVKTDQRAEHYDQLDERAAWFYEALTNSKGMTTTTPGVGSVYLGTYTDKDGDWLDGGKHYRLRVPANVPVKNFWSATVYHNDTRYLIRNKQKRADRSSRYDLIKNTDGSVDLFFGPTAPDGKDMNWIPTNPGEGWFTYFRLYGPLQAYFDRSWVLPSIEKL